MTASIIAQYDLLEGLFGNAYGGDGPTIDMWAKGSAPNRISIQWNYTVNSFTNKTFGVGDVNTTDDTITIAAHGYETGLAFTLTTSGTLPSPFLVATTYYVIVVDANTIKMASSVANAIAGTAIDITTTGSGTQTVNVTALAGASLVYQASNNGTTWRNINSQTVTATGSAVTTTVNFAYRYIRVQKIITSGSFSSNAYFISAGDYT